MGIGSLLYRSDAACSEKHGWTKGQGKCVRAKNKGANGQGQKPKPKKKGSLIKKAGALALGAAAGASVATGVGLGGAAIAGFAAAGVLTVAATPKLVKGIKGKASPEGAKEVEKALDFLHHPYMGPSNRIAKSRMALKRAQRFENIASNSTGFKRRVAKFAATSTRLEAYSDLLRKDGYRSDASKSKQKQKPSKAELDLTAEVLATIEVISERIPRQDRTEVLQEVKREMGILQRRTDATQRISTRNGGLSGKPCGKSWINSKYDCDHGKTRSLSRSDKIKIANKVRAAKGLPPLGKTSSAVMGRKVLSGNKRIVSQPVPFKAVGGANSSRKQVFSKKLKNGSEVRISSQTLGAHERVELESRSNRPVNNKAFVSNTSRRLGGYFGKPKDKVYELKNNGSTDFRTMLKNNEFDQLAKSKNIPDGTLLTIPINGENQPKLLRESNSTFKAIRGHRVDFSSGVRRDSRHHLGLAVKEKGKLRPPTVKEVKAAKSRQIADRLRDMQFNEGVHRVYAGKFPTPGNTASQKQILGKQLKARYADEDRYARYIEKLDNRIAGRKPTKKIRDVDSRVLGAYYNQSRDWARSQGFEIGGVNGFSARQTAAHDISHPVTHKLLGHRSNAINDIFGGHKQKNGKPSLIGEEAVVNVVEHMSRGDNVEGAALSGIRVARVLSRGDTVSRAERDYVRSPEFEQNVIQAAQRIYEHPDLHHNLAVVRQKNRQADTVFMRGDVFNQVVPLEPDSVQKQNKFWDDYMRPRTAEEREQERAELLDVFDDFL